MSGVWEERDIGAWMHEAPIQQIALKLRKSMDVWYAILMSRYVHGHDMP